MGLVQDIVEENVGWEVARREAVVTEALAYLVMALKGDGTQNMTSPERLAVATYLSEAALAVMEADATACAAARQVKLPPWFETQIRLHVTDLVTAEIAAAMAAPDQLATA
jgi:hypothetical protein